jgi:predicted MFS family arabinose efflux permease
MPLVPEPGPLRVLAVASLVNTFGNGLMFTTSALYFTRIVGLSAAQVGIGLTCAGLAGMVSGIPLGHLGDRLGPREMQIGLVAVVAVLTLLYTVVQSFWQFAVLASVVVFFEAGTRSTRGALIARAVPYDRRVYARAYLRSITNIGITLGAAVAGIALHLDTAAAYKTLIVVDAVTYAGAAAVMLWLPHVPVVRSASSTSGLQALRDRPYVAMVLVSSVLGLHFGLIEIGVPLWVSGHTSAPRSLVSLLFIINTVAVVLFQVRASRGIDSPAAGARSMARAGWVLLVACGLFALADGPGREAAVVILVAAAAVHVYGEILQSAGTFCLNLELAPEHAQGQYQGLAGTGMTLSFMLSPALVAFLPLGLGRPGWLILGCLFVMSGMALVPITAWAERTRGRFASLVDDPPVSAVPTVD